MSVYSSNEGNATPFPDFSTLLSGIDLDALSDEALHALDDVFHSHRRTIKGELAKRRTAAGLERWRKALYAKRRCEDEEDVALAQGFGENEGACLLYGLNPNCDHSDTPPRRKDMCWRSAKIFDRIEEASVNALIVRYLKRVNVPPSTKKIAAVRKQSELLLDIHREVPRAAPLEILPAGEAVELDKILEMLGVTGAQEAAEMPKGLDLDLEPSDSLETYDFVTKAEIIPEED